MFPLSSYPDVPWAFAATTEFLVRVVILAVTPIPVFSPLLTLGFWLIATASGRMTACMAALASSLSATVTGVLVAGLLAVASAASHGTITASAATASPDTKP
jgi:NaMN:DMB phosphoribosyltransferase